MLYAYINIGFSKNQCCIYKLTSVLVKTDVDVKIYMNFFLYNSYYITSIFKKTNVVIFMLTSVLEN